ncbi:pyroglutamyl-peptidase 1-like isoform X2 [Gymnodraco acuticeps]|uniref:Pyroglutamyl-peptidase 1-like isoform X2 n=1 Tax=Gymnodraco acuticeps TaxID=8218 RepID=A0A6P8SML4_GYMAC|nr:pyroglutamyl-peptidase 1-like isoform X2 [Gymnodraco acuticeps]
MANKKKVIVTGFEPFGGHAVNSSWVAVQELEKLGLGEAVDLHVCEVPVEYQAVQDLLPSLWKEPQPQLVVHVGVSGLATTVTLEQCGHNKGYKRLDNCSFCPASQCCMDSGPDCIQSVLDMETVCKTVNGSDLGVTLSVSKDAGRFCFIVYTRICVTTPTTPLCTWGTATLPSSMCLLLGNPTAARIWGELCRPPCRRC